MPRVLIIDDDPDVREILALTLARSGLEVHQEADGEAGLMATMELTPDLVLLDWMMPRLTGPEVCRRLREMPETSSVPVLMLSAKAAGDDLERGFAAGADGYIVKPFRTADLLRRIADLLPADAVRR